MIRAPLNGRSRYLTVLIATCNRLESLRQTVESIRVSTNVSHEIIVIDGGSNDGTIEYLKSEPGLTSLFQGKMLGTARAYNEAWRQVDSEFTCWLSDDTQVMPGSLDLAVDILESDQQIGMVGLKMRDSVGPNRLRKYLGAISDFGIINCNHGVLRTSLLRSIGYFNERYHSYTIDPDLTASVLCTGRSVVMTRDVSVVHERRWAEHMSSAEMHAAMARPNNQAVYREKFGFLGVRYRTAPWNKAFRRAITILTTILNRFKFDFILPGASVHDLEVVLTSRYCSKRELWRNRSRPFHLVQHIPFRKLGSAGNPYLDLFASFQTTRRSEARRRGPI